MSINSANNSENNRAKSIYVGEGTYGCGFRPPLKCVEEQVNHSISKSRVPIMGKVFNREKKMNEEIKQFDDYILPINSEGRFTAHVKGYCEVDLDHALHHNQDEFKRCKKFTDLYDKRNNIIQKANRRKYHQLLLEDGGPDLDQASKKLHFLYIFSFMTPLFEGLVQLGKKEKVHMDIKPGNVVFNRNSKRMLYIDFGFATTYDGLFTDENIYLHMHPYFYFSPESSFFGHILNHVKSKSATDPFRPELRKEYLEKAHKPFLKREAQFQNVVNAYFDAHGGETDAMITFFIKNLRRARVYYANTLLESIEQKYENDKNESIKVYKDTVKTEIRIEKIFRPFAEKFDVYSLGATLYEMILHAFDRSDPLSQNPDIIQFNTYRSLYKDVFQLIMQMMHAHPEERMSSQEAFNAYMRILENIPEEIVKTYEETRKTNNSKNYYANNTMDWTVDSHSSSTNVTNYKKEDNSNNSDNNNNNSNTTNNSNNSNNSSNSNNTFYKTLNNNNSKNSFNNISNNSNNVKKNNNARLTRSSSQIPEVGQTKKLKEKLIQSLLLPQLKVLAKRLGVPQRHKKNKGALIELLISRKDEIPLDLIPVGKFCPSGQVRNPTTGRCKKI